MKSFVTLVSRFQSLTNVTLEFDLKSYENSTSTSGTLWHVLKFVEVLKLSKVAGLQSSTLLKMNYFCILITRSHMQ